jgi:diacylglycerol kinase
MPRLKKDTFFRRLAFASAGIRAAWQRESSFHIQVVIAFVVVPVLFFLRPAMIWRALAAIIIRLVLTAAATLVPLQKGVCAQPVAR